MRTPPFGETFLCHHPKEDHWTNEGDFEPLGYWATKGYDIERVRLYTEAANVREHPVLGTTYRVVISGLVAHISIPAASEKMCPIHGPGTWLRPVGPTHGPEPCAGPMDRTHFFWHSCMNMCAT